MPEVYRVVEELQILTTANNDQSGFGLEVDLDVLALLQVVVHRPCIPEIGE